jgi:DNA-binding transcriptional LysR family regulator
MELRTMRYFLAVAREENMTRAAHLLHPAHTLQAVKSA